MAEVEVVPERDGGGRGGIIFGAPKQAALGFLDFIRERGVMGLAIGFVLGTSVQKLVTAFVTDIMNPLIGVFFLNADLLTQFRVGPFLVGDFIAVSLDFLILLAIVYVVFKGLGLERLDKKRE